MSRESPHEKFPAQVLMDLAANRPLRTYRNDGHLHFCFDKKRKQNHFHNFMLSHTPYRCSLGKPKATEAKTRRTKRGNKVCIATEDTSSTFVSLPKIPLASDSLIHQRNGCPEYNTKQEVYEAKKDLFELENEEEEDDPRDFLCCGPVKIEEQDREAVSLRSTIRETRSRSLPFILNRGNSSSCLKSDSHTCKSLNKLQSGENYTVRKIDRVLCYQEKNSSNGQEFTTIMEDGAKVTVNQHRISIEVFMPRTC